MGWPILEAVAVKSLTAALPVAVSTDIPKDVQSAYPDGFVRVVRGPGGDDGITDSPLLDVETFHPNRIEAAELAEVTRQAVLALAGRNVGGALVDAVSTASGPTWIFYGPHVERYVASYRLALRRPR